MIEPALIKDLIIELGSLPVQEDYEARRLELAGRINELLNSDFSKLISVLYRMDVSEAKLKQLLKENPETDAGLLIADLMIERQLQKIKTRRAANQAKQRDNDIDENEKW
jgi:hypothetical protein